MKQRTTFRTMSITLTFLTILISGCSKNAQLSKSADTNLIYKMNGAESFNYNISSVSSQLIVFGEQEISAMIDNLVAFKVTRTDAGNENLNLTVRIDSIIGTVRSPQGNLTTDDKEIRGKEFSMTLSTKGEESDLDEAEKITFRGVGDQESNLKNTFLMVFPDLPSENIGIGSSWTDSDTLDLSTNDQNVRMILNSNNTIEAIESFNGYECYKIKSVMSGERNAAGSTADGEMSSSGIITGTGYTYFATDSGLLIKDYSKVKVDGDLVIPSGQNLPMYLNIESVMELVK